MELTLPESEWLKDGGQSRLARSPSAPLPYSLLGSPREIKQRSNSSPHDISVQHVTRNPNTEVKGAFVPAERQLQAAPMSLNPASDEVPTVGTPEPISSGPTALNDFIINGEGQATTSSLQSSGQGLQYGGNDGSQCGDKAMSVASATPRVTETGDAPYQDASVDIRIEPDGTISDHVTTETQHAATCEAPDTRQMEGKALDSASSTTEGSTQESFGMSNYTSFTTSEPVSGVKNLTAQQRRLHDLNGRNTSLQVTLNDLAMERDQLAAQLRDLSTRSGKLEEAQSSHTDCGPLPQEQFDQVMGVAKAAIKEHISLLHRYNDIRDIAQGLMGMIAEQRAVRIRDVQEDFGIDQKD